jgi:hypothetical protein
MSKTGAAVRPGGAHRRTRASLPPTIKTRLSPGYFLFTLGSFRADTLRGHEDSAEKLRETLR